MKASTFIHIVGVLLALSAISQPAWPIMEFTISCEGTLCGGGGSFAYQYTLMNTSPAPVTLTEFFVGTDDPTPGDYSFILPAGFTATIIPNVGYPPCNVTYTSGLETLHGQLMPPTSRPSFAVIYWMGSATVPAQGMITFAFSNPNASVDHEWFANASGVWTVAQSNAPIAGPSGVFTIGFVHGPGSEPNPTLPPSWGAVKDLFR